MPSIQVEIIRYTEECFAGWAECRLIDAGGRDWRFLKRRSLLEPGADSAQLPALGRIACEVLERIGSVAVISTRKPRGLLSVDGESRFRVPLSALIDD
ncbi:hypothetical protein JVX91_21270 [Pseudomonas sp. PDNC002]|uniref:hypothetical protein n=1 Tax=Pseudomonas sp. PDNC002 TaxID=2811422 RepID=UPI001966CC75|nr:hypothetical protein [Pseudomonas sp. PDNC002]QRY78108.1 hypothetical protein JVX91_21270 [Pseudomonas sp. PDNC002]